MLERDSEMPTKDKEVLKQNQYEFRLRMKNRGYKKKFFWVRAGWDGNIDNIAAYIFRKELKKNKESKDNP